MPEPSKASAFGAVDTVKAVKQTRQLIGRNTRAGIADGQNRA